MPSDSDIFLKAIDVLEERGWHQGNYTQYDGGDPVPGAPVCIVAAVNLAAGRPLCCFEGHTDLAAFIRGPSSWNDAPERTYEDVVLALKRAAHGEQVA